MVAFVAVRNSSFQSQEILILNWRVWTISVAGNPDFLAVNSMFQTNAYALYNMKQCIFLKQRRRHLPTEVTRSDMNKVTKCNATNESLNPETELGVLEIDMVEDGRMHWTEQQKTMS